MILQIKRLQRGFTLIEMAMVIVGSGTGIFAGAT